MSVVGSNSIVGRFAIHDVESDGNQLNIDNVNVKKPLSLLVGMRQVSNVHTGSKAQIERVLVEAMRRNGKALAARTVGDAVRSAGVAGEAAGRFDRLADAAWDRMSALGRHSESDLATFFSTADGAAVIRQEVNEAIAAQLALADALTNLPRGKRTAATEQLSVTANLRVCELTRLLGEMKMRVEAKQTGEADESGLSVGENAPIERKLADVAARSHGTAAELAKLDAECRGLFERLADLGSGEGVTRDEIDGFCADIAAFQDRLGAARPRFTDRRALDGFSSQIAQARRRLQAVLHPHAEPLLALAKNLTLEIPDWRRDVLTEMGLREKVANLEIDAEGVRAQIRYLARLTRDELSNGRMDEVVAPVLESMRRLAASAKSLERFLGNDVMPFVDAAQNLSASTLRILRQSVRLAETGWNPGLPATGTDVRAAFGTNFSLGARLTARVWGYGPEAAGPDDETGEPDEVRTLGSGVCNTVSLCTFVNGSGEKTQRVFKPESGQWSSLRRATVSRFGDCEPGQVGIDFNFATDATARILNCGDLVTQSRFGLLKGRPGIFQELAPGLAGNVFVDEEPAPKKGDWLQLSDVFAIPDFAVRRKVLAEIARKLNRLRWMDVITGQVDRHSGNYFVGIRRNGNGYSVTLKGIDNDQCFPSRITGVQKFVFPKATVQKHFNSEDYAEGLSAGRFREDGENVEVDVGKFGDVNLEPGLDAMLVGFHNLALPSHMDAEFLAEVKAQLANDAADFRDCLRACHLTDAQIDAAVSRLREVAAIGDELAEKGLVFEAGDWTDSGKARLAQSRDAVVLGHWFENDSLSAELLAKLAMEPDQG